MYIRFVVAEKDVKTGRRLGIFRAISRLRKSQDLLPAERDLLDEAWEWMNNNLERPARLSVSARPHSAPRALSWFKATATGYIEKLRAVQHVLQAHGVFVETLTTTRPGKIVYEDAHQIAAHPFADTPT